MADHSPSRVDSIETSRRRPLAWSEQEAPAITAPAAKQAVDVIESADPEKNLETKKRKHETSPGFFATIWGGICSLFGSASTSDTPKSSSSGVQAIGGTPSLQAPNHMETKKFLELLQETRDALERVQETQMEAEGTEAEEKRQTEKWLKQFVALLKQQRELYGTAAENGKWKFVFDQKLHQAARAEVFETKKHVAESAASDRLWGTLRIGATVVTVAITVSIVAINVIPTMGLSLAALPAALPVALQLLQPVATGTSGVTTLMKSMTSKQLGDYSAALTLSSYAESKKRIYDLPSGMKQVNKAMTQSLDIMTQYLNRIERKRRETAQTIFSPAA
jgi:hypothetical protein